MQFLKDIFYLFFPEICVCCKNHLTTNEEILCVSCLHDLPFTHFCEAKDNRVEKIFHGSVLIEQAMAYLFYSKKGKTQEIIYQLKHYNNQKVGTLFGKWIGKEIKNSNRFKNIDYIIPVPLHPVRLKQRGYNQLTYFGKQLSKEIGAIYRDTILIKKTKTTAQKKKKRIERWKDIEAVFALKNPEAIKGKHILLIDDVITTGATLTTCALLLKQIEDVKISVVTMSYTE